MTVLRCLVGPPFGPRYCSDYRTQTYSRIFLLRLGQKRNQRNGVRPYGVWRRRPRIVAGLGHFTDSDVSEFQMKGYAMPKKSADRNVGLRATTITKHVTFLVSFLSNPGKLKMAEIALPTFMNTKLQTIRESRTTPDTFLKSTIAGQVIRKPA